MRALTNTMLFLVAILAVVGLYVFRQQSFASLQKLGAGLGRERARVGRQIAALPTLPPAKPGPARTRTAATPQEVQVTVTVVPVEPTLPTDSIRVGTRKERLWRDFGEPDVSTTSREGERFLETFIYLLEPSKATIVRLVNGTVVSVKNTRTVSPPLLVPQSSGISTPVSLASDVL